MKIPWWQWQQPAERLRRRLMEHEAGAREHEAEAARCSRMRLWEGHADHLGWQAWHDRQAHKLRRKLVVLEAEAWLTRNSAVQASRTGALYTGEAGDRCELPPSRAWDREFQQVTRLAGTLEAPIDLEALVLADVRDLMAWQRRLARQKEGKRDWGWWSRKLRGKMHRDGDS